MIAPAAPPTAAPMIAPRAVEPVWLPMTPPTAAPVAAPMTAPFSLFELIAAQPVRTTASATVLMRRMDIRSPSIWMGGCTPGPAAGSGPTKQKAGSRGPGPRQTAEFGLLPLEGDLLLDRKVRAGELGDRGELARLRRRPFLARRDRVALAEELVAHRLGEDAISRPAPDFA